MPLDAEVRRLIMEKINTKDTKVKRLTAKNAKDAKEERLSTTPKERGRRV
jgi:hypothetical protein